MSLSRPLPPRLKERREEGGGFGFHQAADHLGAVGAGLAVEDARAVVHAAALGVPGAENQPGDPGMGGGLGAHGAGLERDHQRAAVEARPAEPAGPPPQRQHLRMRRRVRPRLDLVMRLCERSPGGIEQHGAHRRIGGNAGLAAASASASARCIAARSV